MRLLLLVVLSGCSFGATGEDGGIDGGRRDVGQRVDTGVREDAGPVDGGTADGSADAGEPDSGVFGPWVEVGTGSAMFELVAEDQVVPLNAGPQGGGRFDGFHIWFGARIHNLEPEQITTSFVILDENRGQLTRLTWTTNYRASPSGDSFEIWGAAPRLPDCCVAVNTPIYMRVVVTDTNGLTANAEVRVIGGDRCEDFTGDVCP